MNDNEFYKNIDIISNNFVDWRYMHEEKTNISHVDPNDPNKFVFGNHEQTCEFLLRQYAPLSIEESVAILHHHAGMSWDSTQANLSEIYIKYPLALLLHTADMLATYLDQHE